MTGVLRSGRDVGGAAGRTLRREAAAEREDAERFIEEVRGDDPEVAAKLRIEERELEAGGLNSCVAARTMFNACLSRYAQCEQPTAPLPP